MQNMPRTPAVYNQKTKWRLNYEDHDVPSAEWAVNYKTARERQAQLEEKIKEDVAKRKMICTTYGQAHGKYRERLKVGAMGMVEETGSKFRLIHDGTHGILVNNRIKVRDQQPSPMIQDISVVLHQQETSRLKHISLVWD